MSDLLKGLAQLKQVRQAEQIEPPSPAPAPSTRVAIPEAVVTVPGMAASGSGAAPNPGRGEEKTLAGRVPLSLHRDLARLVLEAADELGLRRVYIDEALEAAVRIIVEDADVRARWLREVQEVRVEKANS